MILKTNPIVSDKDTKEFNSALLKYMLKLQEENEVLKAKVEHLESMLMSADVTLIQSESE
jgi:hypothetical protein